MTITQLRTRLLAAKDDGIYWCMIQGPVEKKKVKSEKLFTKPTDKDMFVFMDKQKIKAVRLVEYKKGQKPRVAWTHTVYDATYQKYKGTNKTSYVVLVKDGELTPAIKAMCKKVKCSERSVRESWEELADGLNDDGSDLPTYTAVGPELSADEAKTVKPTGKKQVGFIADRVYVENISVFKTSSGLLVVNFDDLT